MNFIDETARLGENCRIGHFSYIGAGVELGRKVKIGNNVSVYPGTIIKDDVTIGDNCVLGKEPKPGKTSTVKIEGPLPPLVIERGVSIGSLVVIYAGTVVGKDCTFGDMATLRENCRIGDTVLIGQKVTVENQVTIGDFTKIQTGAYITTKTTIGERVFVAPMVTTTNDNFMGRTEERFKYVQGPTVKRGARIGGGAILLPGVVVAEETFVAAGALVTKDTPEGKVIKGFPAREVRPVPANELLKREKQD